MPLNQTQTGEKWECFYSSSSLGMKITYHLLSLNLSCLSWSRQQVALVCMWTWIKQFLCFNQDCVISLNAKLVKFLDQFRYFGCNISFTESGVDTCMAKPRTAIDKLTTIWKSDLWWNKTGILSSCSCVSNIVWLHFDFNEILGEKVWWYLQKNVACKSWKQQQLYKPSK